MSRIDGVDLIAKEAKYHSSCYRAYTKGIRAQLVTGDLEESDAKETDRFNEFCEIPVIIPRLIISNVILRKDSLKKCSYH